VIFLTAAVSPSEAKRAGHPSETLLSKTAPPSEIVEAITAAVSRR
jgi:hypothetical protein